MAVAGTLGVTGCIPFICPGSAQDQDRKYLVDGCRNARLLELEGCGSEDSSRDGVSEHDRSSTQPGTVSWVGDRPARERVTS